MPLDGKNYQPCENARILREAAKIMREKGLAKFTLRSCLTGGVCLRGAIISALVGYDNFYKKQPKRIKFKEIDSIVLNYCYTENVINKKDISDVRYELGHVDWNNESERTKEEVIEVLEKAANFAEEKVIA